MAGDKSCLVHHEGPIAQGFDNVTEVPIICLQPWEEVVGKVVILFEQHYSHHIFLNIGYDELILIQLKELCIDCQVGDRVAVLKPGDGVELFRVIEEKKDGGLNAESRLQDKQNNTTE